MAGEIGCGSHASQNLYPALRLGVNGSAALREPIGELVACCDLDEARARRESHGNSLTAEIAEIAERRQKAKSNALSFSALSALSAVR